MKLNLFPPTKKRTMRAIAPGGYTMTLGNGHYLSVSHFGVNQLGGESGIIALLAAVKSNCKTVSGWCTLDNITIQSVQTRETGGLLLAGLSHSPPSFFVFILQIVHTFNLHSRHFRAY